MKETTDEGVECSDEHMRLDLRATMKRSEVMGWQSGNSIHVAVFLQAFRVFIIKKNFQKIYMEKEYP